MCQKCPSASPYVRPSTKRSFDFDDIWYVGRGRRVMLDGMQYDLIKDKGQGHKPLKVGNSAIFQRLSPPFVMWAGKLPRILKLGAIPIAYRGRIFYFCFTFCVT